MDNIIRATFWHFKNQIATMYIDLLSRQWIIYFFMLIINTIANDYARFVRNSLLYTDFCRYNVGKETTYCHYTYLTPVSLLTKIHGCV